MYSRGLKIPFSAASDEVWTSDLALETLNLSPETLNPGQVAPREGRDCDLFSQPLCLVAAGILAGAVEAGRANALVVWAHWSGLGRDLHSGAHDPLVPGFVPSSESDSVICWRFLRPIRHSSKMCYFHLKESELVFATCNQTPYCVMWWAYQQLVLIHNMAIVI